MFESTLPIDRSLLKDRKTLKKTVQSVAIATGALAAGYGAFRLIRGRRADRSYEERAKEWLKQRIENIQTVLDLSLEKAEEIHDEIEGTLHKTLKLLDRAECMKPNMREKLHIAVDKMLLKMKVNLHKNLELKTELQLEVLENFYNELRGWIFRVKKAEAEVEATA